MVLVVLALMAIPLALPKGRFYLGLPALMTIAVAHGTQACVAATALVSSQESQTSAIAMRPGLIYRVEEGNI